MKYILLISFLVLTACQTTYGNKFTPEMTHTQMTETAKMINNTEACYTFDNTENPNVRMVLQKEIVLRKINCGQIMAIAYQQKQDRIDSFNQSIQNQQAINSMNRPRSTYCNGYSCTTY